MSPSMSLHKSLVGRPSSRNWWVNDLLLVTTLSLVVIILRPSFTLATPSSYQERASKIRSFDEGALLKSTLPESIQRTTLTPVNHCLIGELSHNQKFSDRAPDAYCVGGIYYRGAEARLGQLNLFGEGTQVLKDHEGLVMLSAIERSDLWRQLHRGDACPEREFPMTQFRNDWYASEGGYENSKERLVQARFLELVASQITHIDLIKVDQPDRTRLSAMPAGPVSITISNPFNVAFHTIELRVHYESGPGKPVPHYERIPIMLEAGHQTTLEVAALMQRSKIKRSQRTWSFVDASLKGQIGPCRLLSK